MYKKGKKLVCSIIAVIMCFASSTSVFAEITPLDGTAIPQKVDAGESVNGIRGFEGNATMESDPENVVNKVLKLEAGNTLKWNFINDMGTEMSYSENIIISADYYAESGKTLSANVVGESVSFAGAGNWQTASVLVYPALGKYEVFIDNVYQSEGTFNTVSYPSVSDVTFSGDALVYLDNLKVEQWDKTYSDAELNSIYSNNFNALQNNTDLRSYDGWLRFATGSGTAIDYATVIADNTGASRGNIVKFARTADDANGGVRYRKEFATAGADIVFENMMYQGTGESGDMQIMLRGSDDKIVVLLTVGSGCLTGSNTEKFQNIYRKGEWFKLGVVINEEENNYNIFVNDKKINYEPIPVATADVDVARLLYQIGAGTTWSVDDVEVSSAVTEKETVETEFDDSFENGFELVDRKSPKKLGSWQQGPLGDKSLAGEFSVADSITKYGVNNTTGTTVETGTYKKVLKIDSLASGVSDTDNSHRHDDTESRAMNSIVARFANNDDGNIAITADIFPANRAYKPSYTSTRRDNLCIEFHNNYDTSSWGNLTRISAGRVIKFENGNIKFGDTDKTKYTQEAWNKVRIDIDSSNNVSLTIGDSTTVSMGTLDFTEPVTDILIYSAINRGGLWYMDNFNVTTAAVETVKTDITKGVKTLRLENTIDEMYISKSSDTEFTIKHVYYTKNGGQSYETSPKVYVNTTYTLAYAEIVKNEEVNSDVVIYAATYDENGQLVQVGAEKYPKDVAVGASAKINFMSHNIVYNRENKTHTVKLFAWDGKTLRPLADSLDITDKDRTKIFIASDSLSATYTENEHPQAGWGEVLENCLDQSRVQVINYGMGGRSSKSFIEEGRWQKILDQARPGDYVIVSLGANDEKTNVSAESGLSIYTNPFGDENEEGSYKYYLKKYKDDCDEKGLKMILLTEILRRNWATVGSSTQLASDDRRVRVAVMREFAEKHNIPLVDIYDATRETVISMGEEGSKNFYIHNENVSDNTHTSIYGAAKCLYAIAIELSRIDGIKEFVQ